MRTLLFSVLCVLVSSSLSAREYGRYDPQRLLTVRETPAGKQYGFDAAYADQMLNDLASHAKNYPPQFDTPPDRQRAVRDVQVLAGMLDRLIDVPQPQPGLLLRAAFAHSMGHNLDIAGEGDKAKAVFLRLLALQPDDPRANYQYGTFLGGVGQPREALPYLEKALALGVEDAAYGLGMAYVSLGERELALKHLEDYQRRKPGDASMEPLIEAIRHGKIEFQRKKSPG